MSNQKMQEEYSEFQIDILRKLAREGKIDCIRIGKGPIEDIKSQILFPVKKKKGVSL